MGLCHARRGHCPFGDEAGTKHFNRRADARAYSEEVIAESSRPRSMKKDPASEAPMYGMRTIPDRVDPSKTAKVTINDEEAIRCTVDSDYAAKNSDVLKLDLKEYLKYEADPNIENWHKYKKDELGDDFHKIIIMRRAINRPMALDASYNPGKYSAEEAKRQYLENLRTMRVISENNFNSPYSLKLWTKDQDGQKITPYPYEIRGYLGKMLYYTSSGWFDGNEDNLKTEIQREDGLAPMAFSTYFARPGSYFVIGDSEPDDHIYAEDMGKIWDSGREVKESKIDLSPILRRVDPNSEEAKKILAEDATADIDYIFKEMVQSYEKVHEDNLEEWGNGTMRRPDYDPKHSMRCLRGLMLEQKLLSKEFDHGEHGDKIYMTPCQLNVISVSLMGYETACLRRGDDIYVLRTPHSGL